MTISPPEEPTKPGVAAHLRGFGFGALTGAGFACWIVALVIQRFALFFIGLGLVVVNIAFILWWEKVTTSGNGPRPEPRLALARIESRRALSSEHADIPVEFVLTVAPDDATGYRAKVKQDINLVDVPDYKPRGIIVVEYRPERPWDVRIVTEPDDHWARRAETESIDSVPESAPATAPTSEGGAGFCLTALVGLLVGAAIVVLACRGELFDDGPEHSTSALRPGEMRLAVTELIHLVGTDKAFSLSIEPSRMTLEVPGRVAEFSFRDGRTQVTPKEILTSNGIPQIELRALPYERFPALIAELTSTLRADAPWTISVWHLPTSSWGIPGLEKDQLVISLTAKYKSMSVDIEGNATRP